MPEIISSGLLELYATGLASQTEVAQVQEWLAQYPQVQQELDAIERTMEVYAFAHAIEPAQSAKISTMHAVGLPEKAPAQVAGFAPIVGISPIWRYLAAASVILLLGSIILNVMYQQRYENSQIAYEQSESKRLALRDSIELMNEDMRVVKNKYSMPVALNGLEAAPDAAAKVFWMKNTGDVYIDPSNLPSTPAGMQYQLWGIVDGKPVDAGMIITTASDQKYRIQKMKSFGNAKVDAFAVTLETAGGNPTPKGDMYVMGKM